MVDFTKFESVIEELNKIGNPVLIHSPKHLAIVTYLDALEGEQSVNQFKQKILPIVGFLQMLSIETPYVTKAIEKLQNIQYHPNYDYYIIIITPDNVYSGYVEVGPEVQELKFFSSEVFESKKATDDVIQEVVPHLENPHLKEKYKALIDAVLEKIPEATVKAVGDTLVVSAWTAKLEIVDGDDRGVVTVGEVRDTCWGELLESVARNYVQVERR